MTNSMFIIEIAYFLCWKYDFKIRVDKLYGKEFRFVLSSAPTKYLFTQFPRNNNNISLPSPNLSNPTTATNPSIDVFEHTHLMRFAE